VRSYRIHNLSVDTTDADRVRLRDAIRGLDGVDDVTVTAERGEITIGSAHDDRLPGREALAAAVARAGFVLRGRADRWTG
jgi:hypothetical protein